MGGRRRRLGTQADGWLSVSTERSRRLGDQADGVSEHRDGEEAGTHTDGVSEHREEEKAGGPG